jgi:nucleoside-diphosphate-sugar epimerase
VKRPRFTSSKVSEASPLYLFKTWDEAVNLKRQSEDASLTKKAKRGRFAYKKGKARTLCLREMNPQNESVLVTGADGFIGSHLVKALRSLGYMVLTHSKRQGDIKDCNLSFEGVGHVFHLAARTFVPESWSAPLGFYEINVLGTVNVLEFCRAQSASVTLLSSYVYGPPARLPISEDEPLCAFNPYSHTKILAEQTALYYQRQFGVPITIVRPFNVYGPGQDPRFLIPTILTQAIDPGKSAIVVTDLRPRRDYLFVADLVDLLTRTAFRREGGVFNGGSGSSWGVGDLIAMVNSLLPMSKPVYASGPVRPDEVIDVIADISRAEKEFGWVPRVTLLDGLRHTLAWIRGVERRTLNAER